MVLDKFFLFPSLPLEIRRCIYLLATPPRIVEIQEETEDQDEFNERLRTTPVQIRLDPTLAYFAFNWKGQLRSKDWSQLTLEAWGLTSKPRHQPWQPSKATPEISLSSISNRPEHAWELIRESMLYSRAPIPPLLHAFAESRAQLISCGYELAFRTRTAGPKTWFCFDRDTLYIEGKSYVSHSELLTGGPWDVGQFHPEDLRRVKKLALRGSRFLANLYAFQDDRVPSLDLQRDFIQKKLSKLLRLLSGVAELHLVEWIDDTLESLAHNNIASSPLRFPRQPWQFVEVEEVDAMFAHANLWTTGLNAESLRRYKEHNIDDFQFFKYLRSRQQQCLAEAMSDTIQSDDETPISPWSIPKINVVHVLSSSVCTYLFTERQEAWQALCELKAQYKEFPPSVPASPIPPIDVANYAATARPMDLPETPFDQDEEEAFVEAERAQYYAYYDFEDHLEDERKRHRTWFVEKGSVLEPKNTIL